MPCPTGPFAASEAAASNPLAQQARGHARHLPRTTLIRLPGSCRSALAAAAHGASSPCRLDDGAIIGGLAAHRVAFVWGPAMAR
eukprot:4156761-Prymnesium_polylepis.1